MSTMQASLPAGMKAQCENHAECMKMIQAILDDAATETEKEHFRQNMDKCLPCIEMYQLEKCMKESLQTRISKMLCPEKLQQAIRAKLNLV